MREREGLWDEQADFVPLRKVFFYGNLPVHLYPQPTALGQDSCNVNHRHVNRHNFYIPTVISIQTGNYNESAYICHSWLLLRHIFKVSQLHIIKSCKAKSRFEEKFAEYPIQLCLRVSPIFGNHEKWLFALHGSWEEAFRITWILRRGFPHYMNHIPIARRRLYINCQKQ